GTATRAAPSAAPAPCGAADRRRSRGPRARRRRRARGATRHRRSRGAGPRARPRSRTAGRGRRAGGGRGGRASRIPAAGRRGAGGGGRGTARGLGGCLGGGGGLSCPRHERAPERRRDPRALMAAAHRAPWSERVVDGVCAAFAAFTLACQATVLLGGSLRDLL